jgi:hypothetical protein
MARAGQVAEAEKAKSGKVKYPGEVERKNRIATEKASVYAGFAKK